MHTMTTPYLTVIQTAKILGANIRTVQTWITLGEFPNVYKLNPNNKRNSPYRIPRADVEAFLEKRRSKPSQSLPLN